MAKAIFALIVTVILMAVIVSLLNRGVKKGNSKFWTFQRSKNDGLKILGFGILAFVLWFVTGKIVVSSVFWMSVIHALPWIVMILAIWAFADYRIRSCPEVVKTSCESDNCQDGGERVTSEDNRSLDDIVKEYEEEDDDEEDEADDDEAYGSYRQAVDD